MEYISDVLSSVFDLAQSFFCLLYIYSIKIYFLGQDNFVSVPNHLFFFYPRLVLVIFFNYFLLTLSFFWHIKKFLIAYDTFMILFLVWTAPKINFSLLLAWKLWLTTSAFSFILISEFFHYLSSFQTFSFRSLSFTVHSISPFLTPSLFSQPTNPWNITYPVGDSSFTWIVPFNQDSSSLWYTSSFLKGWQTAILFFFL